PSIAPIEQKNQESRLFEHKLCSLSVPNLAALSTKHVIPSKPGGDVTWKRVPRSRGSTISSRSPRLTVMRSTGRARGFPILSATTLRSLDPATSGPEESNRRGL